MNIMESACYGQKVIKWSTHMVTSLTTPSRPAISALPNINFFTLFFIILPTFYYIWGFRALTLDKAKLKQFNTGWAPLLPCMSIYDIFPKACCYTSCSPNLRHSLLRYSSSCNTYFIFCLPQWDSGTIAPFALNLSDSLSRLWVAARQLRWLSSLPCCSRCLLGLCNLILQFRLHNGTSLPPAATPLMAPVNGKGRNFLSPKDSWDPFPVLPCSSLTLELPSARVRMPFETCLPIPPSIPWSIEALSTE